MNTLLTVTSESDFHCVRHCKVCIQRSYKRQDEGEFTLATNKQNRTLQRGYSVTYNDHKIIKHLLRRLVSTADLLLLTQLEVLSSLNAQLLLGLAFLALKSQSNLLGGLSLLSNKIIAVLEINDALLTFLWKMGLV